MATRELDSSPSLAVLYPKALGGAVLPGGGGEELPDEELVLRDTPVERERLEEYCRVCTFEIGDTLPATYPHILTFPLQVQLMSNRAFPFPMVGLVHIENRVELLRPIGLDERLDLRVRAANLRDHDKGRQFDMEAEAEVGGRVVWRSASTYLRRGGGNGGGSKGGERQTPPPPDAQLSIPGDIGRRYGAVSGDRNPIHLHPVTARVFGMPKPIAHGMWLKARCLALLGGALPGALSAEVRFKLPVYIPGKVSFAADGLRFSLHDAKNEKPHLSGMVQAIGG